MNGLGQFIAIDRAFYRLSDEAWEPYLAEAPGEVTGYRVNGLGRFIAVN